MVHGWLRTSSTSTDHRTSSPLPKLGVTSEHLITLGASMIIFEGDQDPPR